VSDGTARDVDTASVTDGTRNVATRLPFTRKSPHVVLTKAMAAAYAISAGIDYVLPQLDECNISDDQRAEYFDEIAQCMKHLRALRRALRAQEGIPTQGRQPLGSPREPACATCGEPFDPTRSDQRYCSSACKQRAYRCRKAAS
jgi:hypothetical protein